MERTHQEEISMYLDSIIQDGRISLTDISYRLNAMRFRTIRNKEWNYDNIRRWILEYRHDLDIIKGCIDIKGTAANNLLLEDTMRDNIINRMIVIIITIKPEFHEEMGRYVIKPAASWNGIDWVSEHLEKIETIDKMKLDFDINDFEYARQEA